MSILQKHFRFKTRLSIHDLEQRIKDTLRQAKDFRGRYANRKFAMKRGLFTRNAMYFNYKGEINEESDHTITIDIVMRWNLLSILSILLFYVFAILWAVVITPRMALDADFYLFKYIPCLLPVIGTVALVAIYFYELSFTRNRLAQLFEAELIDES